MTAGIYKITIDSSLIDFTLTDYPVALHLNASAGITNEDLSAIFSEISDANRKRIKVSTDEAASSQCYVEIESWDSGSNKAVLHVKVPSVSDSTDTDIYIHYDSSFPENTTYVGDVTDAAAQTVWDSDYVLVMHMSEDPASTDSVLYASEKIGSNANPSIASQGFSAVDCTGLTKANGMVRIEVRCSNPAIVTSVNFEMTSSGTWDSEEWGHAFTAGELANLSTIYKTFYLPLDVFVTAGGELDVSQIDFIRIFAFTSGGSQQLDWKNAHVMWDKELVRDSTSNANHGTPLGTFVSGDLVSLLVNDGINLNGSQAVGVRDDNSLDMNLDDWTIEIIMRGGDQANTSLIDHRNPGDLQGWLVYVDVDGKLRSYLFYGSSLSINTVSAATIDDGTFKYIASRFDRSGNLTQYINDSLDGSVDISSQVATNITTVETVEIGRKGNEVSGLTPFIGDIDEIRVSKSLRSTAYVTANDNAFNDILVTYAAVAVPVTEIVIVPEASLRFDPVAEPVVILVTPQANLTLTSSVILFTGVAIVTPPANLTFTSDTITILASALEDTSLDLRAVAREFGDLLMDLRAASILMEDLGFDLRAVDGITLIDMLMDLRATDGTVLADLAMDLRTIIEVPAFKSYVAQRLTSVISDTGL